MIYPHRSARILFKIIKKNLKFSRPEILVIEKKLIQEETALWKRISGFSVQF